MADRMRIVDVCGFYAPGGGGVRSYVEQKFQAAQVHGHELTVIAPGEANREEARPAGRILWIESPAMPFDPVYRRFDRPEPVWDAITALAPDVIEGSSPWRGGWIAGHWPGEAARAFVFHQDFVAGYPQTLLGGVMKAGTVDRLFEPWWERMRRLSARFDVTVAAGEWLARRLAGFGVHRPVAVPFGIEPGRFSSALRDEALRRRLLDACGAGPNAALVLAVGRLHPEKRPHVLIEGFARARAASARELALVLVGDGPARVQAGRLARRHGGVHMLGAVADRDLLARIYASGDLLIHGSSAETFGLVVAEAVASSLPVVAPDAGGAPELARLGASRLYPPGNRAALTAAMLDLLAQPLSRSATAVPTSDEHFAKLFGLYRDLLEERRQPQAA